MESTAENKKEGMQTVSKETLNNWVEQGFNENAFAVYGGTTELLENLIRTGELPKSPVDLEYQRKLVEGGKCLYYALPLIERVNKINPGLVKSILNLYGEQYTVEELPIDLTTKGIIETAKGYALRQSIESNFLAISGVDHYDVLALAREMIPEQFNALAESEKLMIDEDGIDINRDENIISLIKSKFSPSELKSALDMSLKKRGILFYFNSEIFRRNKVLRGRESEDEIMIISDKPLTTSIISGIEVLSNTDMEVLNKYL